MKSLKNNLTEGQVTVQVDFAENYAFLVQNAAPGFHWNNDQATIYNVVINYKNENKILHKNLIIVSDCLKHDAVSVYTFTKIIICFLKEQFPELKKIDYISDGAPQQYKNFKNVINLCYHKEDFNIDATWHFYPTAHGKGPCDGLGATAKRAASKASLQAVDNLILNPLELLVIKYRKNS